VPSGDPESLRANSPDRRVTRRVRTFRAVLFSRLWWESPRRQGTVVNISCEGLQIHTAHPEPVGTTVYLEIHPRPDDETSHRILVRGQVMRTARLDDALFAMGIRMVVALGENRRDVASVTPVKAQQWVDAAAQQIRGLDPRNTGPIVLTENLLDDGPRKATFTVFRQHGKAHRRRRLVAALLILVLGVLLTALIAVSKRSEPAAPATAFARGEGVNSWSFAYGLKPRAGRATVTDGETSRETERPLEAGSADGVRSVSGMPYPWTLPADAARTATASAYPGTRQLVKGAQSQGAPGLPGPTATGPPRRHGPTDARGSAQLESLTIERVTSLGENGGDPTLGRRRSLQGM